MKGSQTYAVETVTAAKATTAALKETMVLMDCSSLEWNVQGSTIATFDIEAEIMGI